MAVNDGEYRVDDRPRLTPIREAVMGRGKDKPGRDRWPRRFPTGDGPRDGTPSSRTQGDAPDHRPRRPDRDRKAWRREHRVGCCVVRFRPVYGRDAGCGVFWEVSGPLAHLNPAQREEVSYWVARYCGRTPEAWYQSLWPDPRGGLSTSSGGGRGVAQGVAHVGD